MAWQDSTPSAGLSRASARCRSFPVVPHEPEKLLQHVGHLFMCSAMGMQLPPGIVFESANEVSRSASGCLFVQVSTTSGRHLRCLPAEIGHDLRVMANEAGPFHKGSTH